MKTLAANMMHAARNRQTVEIGGGQFGPDELRAAADILAAHTPPTNDDARLIAAELLAALESLACSDNACIESNPDEGERCFFCGGDVIHSLTTDARVKHETDCAFLKARAAIAKARGEA